MVLWGACELANRAAAQGRLSDKPFCPEDIPSLPGEFGRMEELR